MLPRLLLSLPFGFAAALAANLPPEVTTPLPSQVLARGASSAPIPLASYLRDPDVSSAVRITVRLGNQTGSFHLALHDSEAPLTVANFKNYVTSGRYAENFFHRSIPGFIIQSGGFRFANGNLASVPAFAPVLNEPGRSNVRGTIAMAKLGGDPNSATNQWFINLANNSANLDAQNGGFTVFGRVLGTGMTAIVDVLASVPTYDLGSSPFFFPWDEIPLSRNPFVDNALYRQDFIESNAALVAPLAHAATSDDAALVTTTVLDGVLTLAASSTLAGTTTIRLTSTDLEGATLTSTFTVNVLSPDPLVAWRQQNFATLDAAGSAADDADPDGDGVANLLEYATGSSPTQAGVSPITPGQTGDALTLAYTRVTDTSLVYLVEAADSLAGPWTTISRDPDLATGLPLPAGPVLVTDTAPLSTHPTRFLRLRVERAAP